MTASGASLRPPERSQDEERREQEYAEHDEQSLNEENLEREYVESNGRELREEKSAEPSGR